MAERTLNAKKTALIIQDLQNDVIAEGGAFAASGAPWLNCSARCPSGDRKC